MAIIQNLLKFAKMHIDKHYFKTYQLNEPRCILNEHLHTGLRTDKNKFPHNKDLMYIVNSQIIVYIYYCEFVESTKISYELFEFQENLHTVLCFR